MRGTDEPCRPPLNPIAAPIFGEFVLGITVAFFGLWMAAHISPASAASFALAQQVLESFTVFFRILAIGAGVVVTQFLGSGKNKAVKEASLTSLAACSWLGIAVGGWFVVGGNWTLQLLNAPAAALQDAYLLLLFLAPGMVLEAYNLNMAAILRAHLQARKSFVVMVIMHSLHLIVSFILIHILDIGLIGFGIGFTLSRLLGLILHLWLWRKTMSLIPRRRDWWQPSLSVLKTILHIGIPGASVELVYRAAFMVSISAAARLGVEALASAAYVLQILRYVALVSMSIGWACEILVGRHIGAGEIRNIDSLVKKCVRNGMCASGLLALSAAIFSPWIIQVFTHDPNIIDLAIPLLWLSLFLELGRVFNMVINGALRASGDAKYVVKASVLPIVFLLGAGSYFIGRYFGVIGIWMIYILDEGLRGYLMWLRWQQRGWLQHARKTFNNLKKIPAE